MWTYQTTSSSTAWPSATCPATPSGALKCIVVLHVISLTVRRKAVRMPATAAVRTCAVSKRQLLRGTCALQSAAPCWLWTACNTWVNACCRLLLLAGGVDSKVRVFVKPPKGDFALACTLTGHDNWVRSVAATQSLVHTTSKEQCAALWVATASQDRLVRLWTLEEQGEGRANQPVRLNFALANAANMRNTVHASPSVPSVYVSPTFASPSARFMGSCAARA